MVGRPLLLFAHGAGLPSTSPWMQSWARALESIGAVRAFDYPYVRAGRRAPDRLPRLIEAHLEALEHAREAHRGPVFLVGKSMGSRVGCHVSLQVPVDGVICLGYPLVGASKKRPVRIEVLEQLRTPLLLVQGTRDRLFPLDLFEDLQSRIETRWHMHVVEEGDHSLMITRRHTKATGTTQAISDARALEAVAHFVADPTG